MILVLGPSTIAGLAARPEVVAAFPFLGQLTVRRQPGCCGQPASYSPGWAAIATAIMSLPPDRKAAFKSLTGADTVMYRAVKVGKVVSVEF